MKVLSKGWQNIFKIICSETSGNYFFLWLFISWQYVLIYLYLLCQDKQFKQTNPSFYSKYTYFEYGPCQNQKTWPRQTAESAGWMLSRAENEHTGTFLPDSSWSWFVSLMLEEIHWRPQALHCTESELRGSTSSFRASHW